MITVIFSTSKKNIFSALIRLMTKSKVSHCAIGVDLYNIPIVIHAGVGGVHVSTRKKFLKDSNIVYEFKVVPDISDNVRQAISMVGEKYDYVGLLGFIPVLMFRWFGRKVKNPFASASAVICSEFILAVDKDKKINEWSNLDPEASTPDDVLKSCFFSPNFELL